MSRIFTTSFSSVYPHYVTKVEKKRRTKAELDQVIGWLTGFDESALSDHLAAGTTVEDFFTVARLNPHASLITGVVCGVRVENVDDPLMRRIRYRTSWSTNWPRASRWTGSCGRKGQRRRGWDSSGRVSVGSAPSPTRGAGPRAGPHRVLLGAVMPAPWWAIRGRCDACRPPTGIAVLRTVGRAASMHGYARLQQWRVSRVAGSAGPPARLGNRPTSVQRLSAKDPSLVMRG